MRIEKLTTRRLVATSAIAAIALALGFAGIAQAAVLHEVGDNFHVIEYEAGGGEAGSVTLHVEVLSSPSVSSRGEVRTTIVSVNPASGWSYKVKKNGGVNAAVEVAFANSIGCSTTFKAKYVPGKTVIDGGVVTCR